MVHGMNEVYRAWGVLASVLNDRGLWVKGIVELLKNVFYYTF